MLSPRLQLAFDLYKACELAADIGTDHARLPAALLKSGKCTNMILSDISESALSSARRTLDSAGLQARADLRLGDGLEVLREACGMISVLGMGGRTIYDILTLGKDRLCGAELLLSAHSNLPHVRRAVSEIGYRILSETPCLDDGRFYLMIHALPGEEKLSAQEIRLGTRLFESSSPLLPPYLRHMREIQVFQLEGLIRSTHADPEAIRTVREDIAYYQKEESRYEHR